MKRIFSIFTAVIFLLMSLGLGISASEISIDVSAKYAVMIEASNAEVLYEKNSNTTAPMASTTKIMTAVVVIENTDIKNTVSVDKRAVGVEGSSAYLKEGQRVSVEELLYSLMLESANDVATELALYVGCGKVESFVALMNEKAEQIGLENTHFKNPHGLCEDGHYSTAYDMALLMRYAMGNEIFRTVTSSYRYNCASLGRTMINHNRLLISNIGCNGGKTGYTKKSGRCLVSSAEKNGTELICVTLNASDDWNDHTRLYNGAFERYVSYELVTRGQYGYCLPVVNSSSSSLYCEATPCRVFLKRDDIDKISVETRLKRFYYGGIKTGDKVGEMVFLLNGKQIAKSDITANSDCDKIIYKNLFERLLSFFIKD